MMFRFWKWVAARWGYRLVKYSTRTQEISAMVTAMAHAAYPLVKAEERYDNSGEYKRHQVYARLVKLYPNTLRTDISMGIELAVRRLKGI